MASEWQKVRFGEIYDIPSRNGLTKPKNIRGHGVKFINMGEVFAHDRIFNVLCDRVPITSKEKETSLLANNDLLFARQSLVLSGAGKCSIFLGDQETVAFESHLIRVRINNKLACPLFLFYLFKSSIGRSLIWNITEQGAGQSGIRGSDLENITFKLPLLKEQKAIAHILGSLDDKIELNRQMNATLEAMAQALFKSWFVDFDPVLDNALAAGNPIPDELQSKAAARLALGDARKALPVEIQALFPSSFVLTEEMGWIPEGWDVESMINMVNSISETYPLRKVDSVIFLNTGDILDGLVLHSTYSSTKDLPGQAKKSIKKGDILYSEIRPQNKRFSYIDFDAEDYVVSTKLMVLRAKDSYDPLFCYFILKQEETISLLQYIAETRSGTFPQITFKELENIKFALPANNKLIESFGELFLHDFFKKSSELQRNSKLLANLRDTLLPKLLSGELRIPDAENLAAEVL